MGINQSCDGSSSGLGNMGWTREGMKGRFIRMYVCMYVVYRLYFGKCIYPILSYPILSYPIHPLCLVIPTTGNVLNIIISVNGINGLSFSLSLSQERYNYPILLYYLILTLPNISSIQLPPPSSPSPSPSVSLCVSNHAKPSTLLPSPHYPLPTTLDT